MPLTVTFDTNTLQSVVFPEDAQRGTGPSGAAVQTAIRAGLVRGFFSETHITLEGIQGKDRKDILGQTRVGSEASSSGRDSISLTVGVRHVPRKPLHPRFQARVQGTLELGMRALMAPARMSGPPCVKGEICPLFMPAGGMLELLRLMDNVNDMATRISSRGVGIAVAIKLGKQSSEEVGISQPKWWFEGLKHVESENKVAEVVREWADGDTVAAHYGFGIDLLCSEDCRENSVLQPSNRKWLNEDFGIRFVTLAELAEMVAS
jgi:hypothetical protein